MIISQLSFRVLRRFSIKGHCLWAALLAAFATPLSAANLPLPLRFTELMYNPPGGEAYEFLELYNRGAASVDLSGYSFDGINYTFPSGTTLGSGGVLLLASGANPTAFATRYPGIIPKGYYGGKLANEGERIRLKNGSGDVQISVDYKPSGFWPGGAAGGGYSLENINLDGSADEPGNWRASQMVNGSPGVYAATEPPLTVRLSEIMANNRSAVTNGGLTPDWVELFNPGTASVGLGGWSLTDDGGNFRKFVFPPSLSLPAGGYLVIWCDSATNAPGLHTGFTLDTRSNTLFLFDNQTNRMDGVTLGNQVPDFTLARINNEWELGVPTPSAANIRAEQAAASSLSINEWYADSLPGSDDWLELYNRSTNQPISLKGFFLSTGGASYQILANSFVAPGGFIQLIADENSGPNHLGFKLPAAGGAIVLTDPTGVEVERIDYGTQSENLSEGRFPDGAAAIVKFPAGASPGASNNADTDGDGIPDFWELQYGLDPNLAADAGLDADGDGFSNLREYLAGTNPADAASVLRLSAEVASNNIVLIFGAVPGKAYSILSRSQAASGEWGKVADIPAAGTNRSIQVTDAMTGSGAKFYQVATPQIHLAGESVIASLTPSDRATNVASSVVINVSLRAPVDPASVTADAFKLLDDLGREVAGQYCFGQDFHSICFTPSIPLARSTVYTVTLTDALKGQDGKPLGAAQTWSFATGRADDLSEDRAVYLQDDLSIADARITTFPQPGGYTLQDINNDNNPLDDYEPTLSVLFQQGIYASSRTNANGSIAQRGQSVRLALQKSYRVKLQGSSEPWRGFETINLNKHPYDLTRVRNKLSFDLFKSIPHFSSLRTLFVHASIDTNDYGLFTHIENPDTKFLSAHGLDPKGQLYKAQFFEFFRYEDILVPTSDPRYDDKTFSSVLEPKGNKDHRKLIAMLADLNDPEIPINRVIDKYFNRDNFLTWFAINILVQNQDTASRNFYLYSPADSSTWYFLPWDYDGAWGFYAQPDEAAVSFLSRWQVGLPNWWGAVICRRFMREPGNVTDLLAKTSELNAGLLAPARVSQLLDGYHDLVKTYISRSPDLENLPVVDGSDPTEQWETEFNRLRTFAQRNYSNVLSTIERPMPVYLGDPIITDDGITFYWDESFDLQGDSLTYDFQLSRTPIFGANDLVVSKTGLTVTSFSLPGPLAAGTYYYRVIVRDGKNPSVNWQVAFDNYYDAATDTVYNGIRQMVVP